MTNTSSYWADWLVDAVAAAIQDRRLLRGEPEEDKWLTEAIMLNVKKAIENAISAKDAEIARLRDLLRECSDDLAAEVEHRYSHGIKDHPAMIRKYERDMDPVIRAQAALEQKP